ncbi:Prp18-domain-containing protein, partial [Meira miltonrushii]
ERFNISNEEAIRRLRQKGEPIRLFGESDKERRLRLRSLELIEQRGEKMGQNDFMKALRGAESSAISSDLLGQRGSTSSPKPTSEDVKEGSSTHKEGEEQREGVGMNSVLDLNLIKKDINKVYPIIYYTLKGLMRDWETSLAERPIEIRQSSQGKLVAATQVQTADYMKPLLKQLRHRSVKPDVLARLAEIVHFVQKREYRNANDSYLQLSIGNAPWPIGVTMVGIHERSGREKIFSSNVAHVLNDEVSRKYIQSLKRLMTFAQSRYPPKDVSMLMG